MVLSDLSFDEARVRIHTGMRDREADVRYKNRVDDGDRQVITLRLTRIHDLFEMPLTDLFSEYRNFLTGIDFCLSELRARRSQRPVRLDIGLPSHEIDDAPVDRVQRTLRRYCDHRIRYNRCEDRALRVGAVSALRIGLPLTVLGLIIMIAAMDTANDSSVSRLIADHFGFVLAWIGLWFPLDQFFFYPLSYRRENRVLRLLRDAEIVIHPFQIESFVR